MENVSALLQVLMWTSVVITVWGFFAANSWRRPVILLVLVWIALQTVLSLNGFYLAFESVPPRMMAMIGPPLLMLAILFFTRWGRRYMDGLDAANLVAGQTARFPVELMLHGLFLVGYIPEAMTYSGMNFDILTGLTAPFIAYFGYRKQKLSRGALIAWNLIGLGLALSVVSRGILSAPTPFQQFSFDQPNVAVFYFPFSMLPAVVVPLAFYGHAIALRQLLVRRMKNGK